MTARRDGWWISLQDFCSEYDVSRSVAYELIDSKLLDSFLIGRRRYIIGASIETLPQKMKACVSNDRFNRNVSYAEGSCQSSH